MERLLRQGSLPTRPESKGKKATDPSNNGDLEIQQCVLV
jgi:hypothetical protein